MSARERFTWPKAVWILAVMVLAAWRFETAILPARMLTLSLAIVGVVLLVSGRAAQSEGAAVWRLARFGVGAVLILGLMALYASNPSHHAASGGGLLPIEHLEGWPAAVNQGVARESLVFTLLAVVLLAVALGLSPRAVRLVIAGVTLGAAVMAFVVVEQRLTPRPFPVYPTTGVFVSRNHFAAFANLAIFPAVALGVRMRCRAVSLGRASSPAILYALAVVLMVMAVFLTRSRAGIAILLLLSVPAFLLGLRLCRRYPFFCGIGAGRFMWGVGIPSLLASAAGVAYGLAGTGWRPASWMRDLAFRGEVAAATWKMFRERLWWGTGPGSFSVTFPYYQPPSLAGYAFRHAHCEPIEFLAEFGLLGAGLLLTGFVMILWAGPPLRRAHCETPSFRDLEGVALGLALAGVCLHAWVDFPFRHPLIALLALVWCGLLRTAITKAPVEAAGSPGALPVGRDPK